MPTKWPIRPPQELRLPLAKPLVSQVARRANVPQPELARLAAQLLRMTPLSGDFRQDVQLFLDWAHTIHVLKIDAIGVKAPPLTTGFLTEHVGGQIAVTLRPTVEEMQYLEKLSSQLKGSKDPFDATLFFPVDSLLGKLQGLYELRRWVYNFQKVAEPKHLLKLFPDLRTINAQVMSELLGLRTYGIKPAFFQDGFFHHSSEAWVLFDPKTYRRDGYKGNPETVATLLLTQQETLANTNVRVEMEHLAYNDHPYVTMAYGFRSWVTLELDREGQLQFREMGLPLTPADVFAEAEMGWTYELFRMVQILRLYDLVVPTETVASMPRLQKGLARFGRKDKGKEFPDLLVPRLQSLDVSSRLREQLEREVDRAREDTARRSEMGRHDVIDHVRQLPEGRHPTPRARELARENLGIELGPNETYVRPHERGTGPKKAKIHRAKRKKR